MLLSGRGEEEAERAEQALIASGADWTVLRAAGRAELRDGFFRDAILSRARRPRRLPEPFVDADDIADIAFAALTDDAAHVGRLYELTGPRALTFAEAVAELARASGRGRLPPRASGRLHRRARCRGPPADLVWLTGYLFATVLDGRNARPQPGVQQALGRPPRDFAAYARQAAAAGAWS